MHLTKPSIMTNQTILPICVAIGLLIGPVHLGLIDLARGSEANPCLQNKSKKIVKEEGRYAPPFTIDFADNQTIFLSGLILEQFADPALRQMTSEFVLSFLGTDSHQLHLDRKAKMDRYGRRPAFLSRPKDPHSAKKNAVLLQERLLARGLARVDPSGLASQCARYLLDIERRARLSKAGLWSDPTYRIRDAGSLALDEIVSTYQIIHGSVLRVSRNPTRTSYLNFGRNWKTDFTISLSKKNLAAWEARNNSLDDLADVPIYVRGWIEDRGGPLIRVTHPQQLVTDHESE